MADSAFASGPSWFSAGPAWLMNAMPGSNRTYSRYVLDRSGDLVEATPQYNGYVGTLRDVFDVGLFGNVSGFGSASTGTLKLSQPVIQDAGGGPNAPLAGPFVWNSTAGNGAWLTAGNWTPSGPPGATDLAQFGNAGPNAGINFNGTTNAVSLGTVGGVTYGKNEGVGAIEVTSLHSVNLVIGNSATVVGGANGTLTLNTASVNGVSNVVLRNASSIKLSLQDAASGGTQNMFVNLGSATDNVVLIDGSGDIVISSIIVSPVVNGKLTLDRSPSSTGTGSLTLTRANTYSGGTVVNNGILQIGTSGIVSAGGTRTSGPVGTGTLTLSNGATLRSDGSNARTIQNNISLSGSITLGASSTQTGNLTFNSTDGTNALTTAATAVLTGNTTLTTLSDVTIADVISGGFSLSKAGAGTLVLGGNNTYSGGTTVTAGLLQLNSSSALGSSSGSLTVNGGIVDLNGQNTSVGNLTGSGGTIWNNGPNSGSSTVTLTIGNGNTGGGNYAGVIQDNNGASTGKVALVKTGTGTITLSGTNTYTGLTTVTGGKLFINGNSSAATGAVNVNSGGTTLGGNGVTGGAVTVASGSNLSPGPTGVGSTGVLGTGALTLNSGSFFNVDLNNTTAGTGYDQVSVTGTVSIGGSNLVVSVGGVLSVNDKFFITLNNGTDLVTGTFAQGVTVTADNGYTFLINYLDNGDSGTVGNDISLTLTAIPEPSTWIGAALALGAIGFTQRKRFTKRSRAVA